MAEKVERNKEIIRLFESGLRMASIARRFGVTPARVSQIVERHKWRVEHGGS